MQVLLSTSQDQARKVDAALAARQGIDVCEVPAEGRCRYPSKPCLNARAAKAGGKLHRFCEFHRLRANGNQRRWTSVRRQLARYEREAAMMAVVMSSPMGFCVPGAIAVWDSPPSLSFQQRLPPRKLAWPQFTTEVATAKPSSEPELSEADLEILTSPLSGPTKTATV